MPKRSVTHHYDKELANMGTAKNPAKVQKHVKHHGETKNYVYRVVLTGGPCGGKSSSLDDLTKALTKKGFDVMCVPEVPTILLNGGCKYPGTDGDQEALIVFEKALIQAQLQLERSFIEIAASTNRPTIVVMDRGLLDVAAYLPREYHHLFVLFANLIVLDTENSFCFILSAHLYCNSQSLARNVEGSRLDGRTNGRSLRLGVAFDHSC